MLIACEFGISLWLRDWTCRKMGPVFCFLFLKEVRKKIFSNIYRVQRTFVTGPVQLDALTSWYVSVCVWFKISTFEAACLVVYFLLF